MTAATPWTRLNLFALLLAGLVLLATGLAWWRDRVRTFPEPRWEPGRFTLLAAPGTAVIRERWVVAVSLRCPHCQRHLRALAKRIEGRPQPPALAALVVDQPARPPDLDLGVALPGGAWWDSAQVWREGWGRRVYGETFRFDASGALLSSTPAGVVPDSAGVTM